MHKKIFYGWWLVLGSSLLGLLGGGIILYGFGAFFDPIRNEFAWSATVISMAFSFLRLENGVAAPFVGLLFDKIGPRKMVLFGTCMMSAGFLVLANTNSLITFYLAFILMAVGYSACSGTVLISTVATWFIRKRGRALGMLYTGFGLAGTLAPVLVSLIDRHGWRTTAIIISWSVLTFGIPISVMMKHRPEQYGYLPDGINSVQSTTKDELKQTDINERNFTLSQTLKMPTFWYLAIAIALSSMCLMAVIVHLIPYLTSTGFTPKNAAFCLAGMSVVSICGRPTLGWLGDKFDKRLVFAFILGFMSLGLFLLYLPKVASYKRLIPFLLVFGTAYGGLGPIRAAIQGEYFGRMSFGAVQGVIMACVSLGGAIGPTLVGWIVDRTENYPFAFAVLATTIILVLPVVYIAKRPFQTL